jgi:hypothetical protein
MGNKNSLANLGKPKGALNKTKMTNKLRRDIFECYEELGGKDYLAVLATEDTKSFTHLLTKLIPQELRAEIGRPGDFDHLSDKELDDAIIVKFQEQYRDRFPQLAVVTGGEGTETVHSEPHPVHQEDPAEIPAGETPLPDSGETGAG